MSAALSLVTNSDIPSSILDLDRALRDEFAQLAHLREQAAGASSRWEGTTVSTVVSAPEHDVAPKLVRQVIREVVRLAESSLSQPGAPLRCNVDDWVQTHFRDPEDRARRRAFHDDDWRAATAAPWEEFRPADLWRHIVSAYAPDRIIQEARRRAAERIIRVFWLRSSDEIRRQGSRIELVIRRWSEKEWSGTARKYPSRGDRDLQALREAMEVFHAASGIDTSTVDLCGLADFLASTEAYDFRFHSRDRQDFRGALSAVLFNNEIKVYLPDHVAGALNMFLSEHGADLLADR